MSLYMLQALRLLNTSAICGAAPERPATERVNVLWDLSDVLDEDLLKIDTYEDDEIGSWKSDKSRLP